MKGCPNAAVFERRLAQAIAGLPSITLTRHVIDTEEQAARWGMTGSPTLLIDGRDPFGSQGAPPALACRLYPGPADLLEPAPTVDALRRAIVECAGR